MRFEDRWGKVDGVKIHYLESIDTKEHLTPIVYIPGALNYAEQSTEFLESFSPRKCITMSLRGRGKSDAPDSGYSFGDHVRDLQAVVIHSNVQDYCLMAYSMGVPFAIKFASDQPNIKALIICDYPAKYPSIPETWSDRILKSGYISDDKQHVVKGIQKDSIQVNLTTELSLIKIPVLIIKGGKEGSLLKDVELDIYKSNLTDVKIVEIVDSGHELWMPDITHFTKIIEDFLDNLDESIS